MIYVIMYLVAILLANLTTAVFGPSVTVLNAFLFIGLDLTARDKLHEAWHGNKLLLKMVALITVGSALSWLLNRNAGQIALASMLAFGAAELVDTAVYQLLYRSGRLTKMNGSNVFSAAADSLVFPTVAFGSFLPLIVLGQFSAKVLGGFVWSLLLTKKSLGKATGAAGNEH